MLTRRNFIKTGTVATLGAAGASLSAAPSRVPQSYFGLHPFIEQNPKAVFIRRTHVPHKMHEESKLHEGLTLAREIFVPRARQNSCLQRPFRLPRPGSLIPIRLSSWGDSNFHFSSVTRALSQLVGCLPVLGI